VPNRARQPYAGAALATPQQHDVFWVVVGWALLYGSVRALLTESIVRQ
jgi:hypothetical protein